jgi:hypothetical protein
LSSLGRFSFSGRTLLLGVALLLLLLLLLISKSLKKYLSNMPGKHKIKNYGNLKYWALDTYTSESTNVKVK